MALVSLGHRPTGKWVPGRKKISYQVLSEGINGYLSRVMMPQWCVNLRQIKSLCVSR